MNDYSHLYITTFSLEEKKGGAGGDCGPFGPMNRRAEMPDYVPATQAEFYWIDGERDVPERFVVIDQRSGLDPATGASRQSVQHLDNSAGALVAGWMTEGGDLEGTPEGLFAGQFLDRVTERKALRDGLAALAIIEECEWARRMVATLDELERRRA